MKKSFIFFLFGFFIFSFDVYSDDHHEELPNVANVQVNVCKLKEGVSLKEYNACLLYTSPSPRDVEESGFGGWGW